MEILLRNRFLKFFLAFIMAFGIVGSMGSVPMIARAETPVVLAEWDFSQLFTGTPVTLPVGASSGLNNTSSFDRIPALATTSYTTATKSVYTSSWESSDTIDKYWLVTTKSAGYENLNVKFDAWGSNTGPKNFSLEIKSGATWTKVSDYALTATSATINIDLPEAANNQNELVLRFRVADTVSINGSTIAGTGTSRMANIVISGSEIIPLQTDVLAQWDFSQLFSGSTSSLPVGASGGLFNTSSFDRVPSLASYSYTASSKSVYVANWESANTIEKYWLITTKTTGYKNINVKFDAWGSNTGPKNFSLEIKSGSTWTNVADYSLAATTANTSIDLPVAANNQNELLLRFRVADTVAINGGTVAGGGTSRMANIVITGDTGSGTITKVATPTAVPANNSTVAEGSSITLATTTSAASIYYTTDGTTPNVSSTLYQAPFALNFGAASSKTVKAIAIKSGFSNSDVATFTYNKEAAPTVISIAEAKTKTDGQTVIVEGEVTGAYNSSTVYMQDGTGSGDGILLNSTGANAYVGSKIRVTGVKTLLNGSDTIVFNSPDATIISAGLSYAPVSVSLDSLVPPGYRSMMVCMDKVQIIQRNAATTLQNHTIGSNIQLRTALPSEFADGDYITIKKAYVYWYNVTSNVQLMCDASDIVKTEPPTDDTDGSGTLAQWISPTITDVIDATGGVFNQSKLQIVGTSSTVLNWASSGINRAGGFDGKSGSAYWLATMSSKGFKNLKMTFSTRSSATGPRDFKIQYSTNGTTWYDANNPSYTIGSALNLADPASQYAKSLPDGASNANLLYVRWLLASNTSANGGTIGSGGTNTINNIIITGDYILPEGQLKHVEAVPGSGAVALSQNITFDCSANDLLLNGYMVKVSSDDGQSWTDAAGGSFILPALPITIKVKATAPGKTDSRITEFSYTQAKLPLVISSKGTGAVIPGATIALTHDVEGVTILYSINGGAEQVYQGAITLDDALFIGDPATLSVSARAVKTNYVDSDSIQLSFTKKITGGEKVYFGQIHSHTTNSDGDISLEGAYTYARDVAKLDFFAVTDHSNSMDTAPTTDKAGTYNLDTYNSTNQKWINGQQAAANAYRDDFISIYGYEMTWTNKQYGHMNTYNTKGFVSRNNVELANATNGGGLKAYYELLKTAPESISAFNHPGPTFGNFSNFAYYDPLIDQRVSLIEVGNGEGVVGSSGYFRSINEYSLALDKGWHLAPSNNQDNHHVKWGDANTCRTAIWTNDLSINGLYQALREMRVYSTEVDDFEIVYKVNGQPLGSILEAVPSSANFTAEMKNPTEGNIITSVCLVTNGGTELQTVKPNTKDYNYNSTIANPKPGYYYLKVVLNTPEGERFAVTAPVWLGAARSVGFNDVTKDSVLPIAGESLKLTATLFNNETKPVTLKSLEYKDSNGRIIGSFPNLNTIIDASETVSHDVSYIPTVVGETDVTVTAVVLFADGKEETYIHDISYNVRDVNKLSYIGIDGSHANEYVSGNYFDSMTNFAEIASDYDVRVEILSTSNALISATTDSKFKAIILTPPSRRSGSAARLPYANYSQAELDALKTFSERGGALVITNWGNYYENYTGLVGVMPKDEHMSSQQNKILAAIGSTLRLSDDEVRDPLQWNSATDTFRLYLTNTYGSYNWASPLLNGVDVSQVYSQYGGTSIYTVAPANKGVFDAVPSSAVPTSVIPAVMLSAQGESVNQEPNHGVNTNYRTDYTKFNDRFMVAASETVMHENGVSSFVIASGGSFMSNFEVKAELDNASSLQYSNYNIAVNLLKMIAPEPDITPIANARLLPQGTTVTIEGIATSNVYSGDNITNTGLFDCIYVQDATGGINLHPVASGLVEGQKIRVTGKASSYQNETQLSVSKVVVVDSNINKVAPTAVTTAEAMSPANTGLLIKTSGRVSKIIKVGDRIGQFALTDSTGVEALVFINAYITSDVDLSFVIDGAKVNVIGFGSIGENSANSDFVPRIRVRDRNEITAAMTGFIANVTEASSAGGVVSVKTSLQNYTDAAKDCLVMFAVYDSKGKLVAVQHKEAAVGIDQTRTVEHAVNVNWGANYYANIYVWSSSDYAPIIPAVSVSIS